MSQRSPGIRPRPTLSRRLDAASRIAFPSACTALLLLLLAAPLHVPGQAELQPAAALACVFFWSLFRPASMTPPLVFLLGLLTDLLGLGPPGVSVLTLLAVHGLALRLRALTRYGFGQMWLGFVAVAAGASAFDWVLRGLLAWRMLPPGPALFQFALAAGLYPALAALFTRAHRGLADPQRA